MPNLSFISLMINERFFPPVAEGGGGTAEHQSVHNLLQVPRWLSEG